MTQHTRWRPAVLARVKELIKSDQYGPGRVDVLVPPEGVEPGGEGLRRLHDLVNRRAAACVHWDVVEASTTLARVDRQLAPPRPRRSRFSRCCRPRAAWACWPG